MRTEAESGSLDLTDDELLIVLRHESTNRQAPQSYKSFMRKLIEKLELHLKNEKQLKNRVQHLENDRETYAGYVRNAEKNYDELSELMKQEIDMRVELESKVKQLESDLLAEKQKAASTASTAPTATTSSTTSSAASLTSSTAKPPTFIALPETSIALPNASTTAPILTTATPNSPVAVAPTAEPIHQQTQLHLIEDLQRKLVQTTEERNELKRALERQAVGRQNLEKQLVRYMVEMNQQRTRIKELEAELQRASSTTQQQFQLLQNKDASHRQLISQFEQLKNSYFQALQGIIADPRAVANNMNAQTVTRFVSQMPAGTDGNATASAQQPSGSAAPPAADSQRNIIRMFDPSQMNR